MTQRQTLSEYLIGELTEGRWAADSIRRFADRGPEEFREVAELAGLVIEAPRHAPVGGGRDVVILARRLEEEEPLAAARVAAELTF